ncbi:sensor histidine kinase [Gordonia sp. (in: high G+C Gram-positive bacteria)]|uniref:sensor histidine kinase n=1 Tax=Gordonia sp. (in: high G+C Gram-positive bacteria) TaxID=84139 RepID=UPI003F9CE1D7
MTTARQSPLDRSKSPLAPLDRSKSPLAPLDRWQRLSEPAKYRAYTRWTLEGTAIVVGLTGMIAGHRYPSVVVATAIATVSALLAFESRPELTTRTGVVANRRLAIASVVGFAAAWGCSLFVATDIETETGLGVAWVVVGFVSLSVFAFSRWRWLLATVSVAVTVAAFGAPGDYVPLGVTLLAAAVVCIAITRLSLWALRIVDGLDKARETQAQLHVAEERLRFSRDLHDVVGRGFSTIAVKSELASRLSRAGAAERAADEMDEVKALAVASMEEMRSLVRGYRGINLTVEIAGARALLDSAGCLLTIQGDSDAVPEKLHETAAWVVREGTTNIVRHSSATAATLTLGQSGMSLTNDGVTSTEGEYSGLRGLTERLDRVGGLLTTHTDDDQFTLEIRWETA